MPTSSISICFKGDHCPTELRSIDVITHASASRELDIFCEDKEGQLGGDDMRLATELVKNTPTLEELCVTVVIDDDQALESFVAAVQQHRGLLALYLQNCGLGFDHYVLFAVLPAFSCRSIHLNFSGNNIGARGASLVSIHLALNPPLEQLLLSDNDIDDGSTFALAESMKKNTNLVLLDLMSNLQLTSAGSENLAMTCYADHNLNILHDCNYTCT